MAMLAAGCRGAGATSEPVRASGAGCTGGPIAAATTTQGITVAGTRYTYILDLPLSDGHTALPVVFDFPGLGEHAKEEAAYSHLAERAAARGWIGVTPEASGAIPLWTLPPLPGPDDVAFFNALLADLESRFCVDTARLYAAGISNGASFAGALACQSSSPLAAIGVVAGINGYAVCKNLPPLAVVGFNGTADPIVPYNGGNVFGGADQKGGGIVPAATAALSAWGERNRCPGPATTSSVASDVELSTFAGCAAPAELYTLTGGGHTWPGAAPVAEKVLGPTNASVSATQLMLDFFARSHA